MNKKYKNLKITTDRDHAETVAGIIGYLLNPDGIEETDMGSGHVCINAYISYDKNISDKYIKELINKNLNNVDHELEIMDFDYDPATEIEWKKYFKPQKIGKHIVVKPSWEEYIPETEDIVVMIDPGMAFGTGLHETTRGIIILLEDIIEIRKQSKENIGALRMLDAGTGSGILSIAAYKMGIKNILAIDNDIEAVDTAKENILANNIKCGINAEDTNLEELIDNNYYDIILANITPDVLITNKKNITDMLREGADLILSGILEKEEKRIIDEFSEVAGLRLFKKIQIEEWSTLWFRLKKFE
ncbi:MAG: 50S ribosomal protein L11 methyltransferase [Proteobacteria bacterium]|nr:50S ribosomal protein L11 methyltransferase [Pseudomonadota bacterium]